MKLVFMGSGAFGLPSLEHLSRSHDVQLVITQPDRPSGRGRHPASTPIGAAAEEAGIQCLKTPDANEPFIIEKLNEVNPDAIIVIAFGQKLGPALLDGKLAMNLHASLLPRHRGAAPIQWAIIQGDGLTGLSVITLADRIDAGDVLGMVDTPIDPSETAGGLHDRLADMGPPLLEQVLLDAENDSLQPVPQDEEEATHAPKLRRSDATVHFDQSGVAVRNRVHGLTPWPGCDILFCGSKLRLLQVEATSGDCPGASPGQFLEDGTIACRQGGIRLLKVQEPGRRPMDFQDWIHGHAVEHPGMCTPL